MYTLLNTHNKGEPFIMFQLNDQQKSFYETRISSEYAIWNHGVIDCFTKKYSYNKLNSAFNSLIETFENLRLRISNKNGELVSYIDKFTFTDYPFVQFKSENDLQKFAEDFINAPIDSNDILFKCIVFCTPEKSGYLICAHHIIIDGFSTQIMADFFDNYLNGKQYISEKIHSYEEYVKTEETYKKSNRFNRDKKFWTEQFSTKPNCSVIQQKSANFDYSASELNLEIPHQVFIKATNFCNKNDISLNAFFNTIHGIYLSQKYETDNFTIGVPVLNRTTAAELNTIGLYMHVLPLVVNISSNTFLNTAKNIEDSHITLYRHQKFTQYDIKELLKEDNKPVNTLFDVVCDYQEFQKNDNYEFVFQYSNALSTPLEIHLQSFNNEKHNLKIRYQTALFSEKEIQLMLNSIVALIENALENPDKNIYELEMVSTAEKQKILKDFNNTTVDYPRNKCIHELFEEQVVKTPDKTALVAVDKRLTYKELNEEANRIANTLIEKGVEKGDIVAFVLPRRSYVLSTMLGILKTGAAYLPIDPDYPKDRIEYILHDSNAKICITEENINKFIENINTSNPCVIVNSDAPCYCIYTSGSTGKPKGTLITHKNVVNYSSNNKFNVKSAIIKDGYNKIVSVTTTGFDIFVTESLLPLINGMEIILADEEQSKIQSKLSALLNTYPADVIQTTPTKMKAFISDKNNLEYLRTLKVIILGGEALDKNLVKELKEYTDAEIFNIYGPTETTVWSTFGEVSDIEDVHIGKPIANTQIYIVDKYMNPAPIGVTGELCIGGDGVCAGYLNRPELTAEKFIDNPFGDGKLYKTGDLAYWREDGNIVFVGRNDFQVKIRGQRIELGEIENAVASVDGVLQSAVVVRKDSDNRQFICAFYTGEDKSAQEIKSIIASKLPKYMVPHIFCHLNEMPLTSSGKISRKSLPEVDFTSISTETEYIAPETSEEFAVCKAVENVLKIENVSTLENFFDIGGDSLKSIELISALEKSGYTISVSEIFESINIQDIAKRIAINTSVDIAVEYDSVIPATAAQLRVYTSQYLKPDSAHYNVVSAFTVDELDTQKLEYAVNKLIERHESLRTHFENIDGQIVQVIDDCAEIKVQALDSEDVSVFNTPFDLTQSPLIKVGYYKKTVMIVLHHIIADGESMSVFFSELNELYLGRDLPKTIQYGEFAVTDTYSEDNEQYWLNVFSDDLSPLDLPTDYSRPDKQTFNGSQIYSLIDDEVRNSIAEKCKQLNVTPYVFYLACYDILLSKFSGNSDICVGIPVSGRTTKFLNTIGMFVNTIALRSNIDGNLTVNSLMQSLKDDSISAINNQNYPFNELVNKLGISNPNRNPIFDVMFAYQSDSMTHITFDDKKATALPVTLAGVKCDMTFNIFQRTEDVVLMVEYSTDLFKEKTVNRFIQAYKDILSQCLNENLLIKGISAMSENEEDAVLNQFNNTEHTYNIPDNATLYSLFEKLAENNKEKICIKANGKEITFGNFKRNVEALDCRIREITKSKKSIVAVICERSFEMYAAIYGIIRGGNAYLPIDPDYPQERIEYILKNSNAALVVAQDKFTHLVSNLPCIDMTELINGPTEEFGLFPPAATEDDTAYVIYTSGSTGNPKGAKVSHKSAVNRILWMHDKYPLLENDVILQKTPYTFDVSVWEHFWWGIIGGTLAVSKPGEHFLPAKILDEVFNNKVTHLHFVPSVFELFLNYLEAHKDECSKFNSVKYVFLSGEALTANLVKRFYALFDYNKVTIHNLYGPTECAVDVTYYDCSPADSDPVPIGKPIYNTQMYVVDKFMNPVPLGVTGELCIAGVNVGQGYLNSEELTNEKFIDNPFGSGKLYKTGDLAYWRDDGNIIFVGRKDTQIKLNGQRIEIGEIESVISSINGIETIAVIIKKVNSTDSLVAFYTGKQNIENNIKDACLTKLPKYMVPSAIIHLDSLPLNQSGKLDRKSLTSMEIVVDSNVEDEKPLNETEQFIFEAFERILNKPIGGRNSDFFDFGGTSLSMIALLSEPGFEEITASEFISNSTPAKLALVMNSKKTVSLKYMEALHIPDEVQKALIVFPFAAGGPEAFSNLTSSIKKHNNKTAIYFVRYLHSFEDCREASKEIKTVLSGVETSVYSHCVGSALALQIISELEANSFTVKNYLAGASIPPAKPTKRNVWNICPNGFIKKRLINAGAQFGELPEETVTKFLNKFKKDTTFATKSFYNQRQRIKAPVTIIISKNDPFTKDYKNAEKIWNKYAENIKDIYFINANTHYFQTENHNDIADIICNK